MNDDRNTQDKINAEAEAELQRFSDRLAELIADDDVTELAELIANDNVTESEYDHLIKLIKAEVTPEKIAQRTARTLEWAEAAAELLKGTGPESDKARAALESINSFIRQSAEKVTLVRDILFSEESREHFRRLADALDELYTLRPYIEAELKKPEYDGVTFRDLIGEYTPAELLELPEDSALYKAIQAARAARNAALPVIGTHRTNTLNTPVDRVNFLAWNNFKDTGGQIAFNLMSDRDKRDPARRDLDITMRYSLSFDPNLKTTKEINHYDRRLMQAADTLYTNDTSGQHVFLLGDIFRAMGNKGDIGNRREKITNALDKLATAQVLMDNAAEAEKYDYPHVEYKGNILSFEQIRVTYNGQEVDAIHFLRRPVFMELAAGRNQITEIPLKVLQSGVSQTDDHLRIEDYLLHRIARQKDELRALLDKQKKKYTQDRQREIKEKAKLTILLDTFYENTGKTQKKSIEKTRAVKTSMRYLNHYKSDAGGRYISDYEILDDRIIIHLPTR